LSPEQQGQWASALNKMGKTKTAFVTESAPEKKTSQEQYREKRERQAAEAKAREAKKIHIAGLKGGQRVKTVGAEMPAEALAKSESTSRKATRAPRIRGKKYQEARVKVDKNKAYPAKEALALIKETSYSAFNGAVELHLVVKKTGLSANVSLPHAAGKEKRVEIANEKTIEKLKANKIDFDVLVATPEIMPKIVPFAKILGPKGLMPNPKNGTLVPDLKAAKNFSAPTLILKTEKEAPLIHTVVGKVSQKDTELIQNLETIIKAVSEKQIVKAYLKATMGPAIKLSV